MSDIYWQTNKSVSKELNAFLASFCENKPEFNDIRKYYCDKKTHLNGIQFYAGYIAGGGKKWQRYIAVPIIIELIMIWAYKTNQIIDDKKEVWQDKENIKTATLQHDLLLVLIFDLLASVKKNVKGNFEFLDDLIKEMISAMVRGFHIEKEQLNAHFSSVDTILKDWKKKYSRRNIYFNLVYDYAPLIGYWLASGDKGIFTRYHSFFKGKQKFSEVGQIINDMGDWNELYDSGTRVYQDQYADIRNGLLTFPVHAAIGHPLIKKAIADPQATFQPAWQKGIQALRKELSQTVKKMGKKCFADLVSFWKANNKSGSTLISETYLLLKHNKYLNS